VREIFVFGEAEGATPFADLLDNDGRPAAAEIDPHEDVVALPYSSGTTGLPKGVMLTHRNLVANICQCQGQVAIAEDDVIIAVLPFYHIYGMEIILNACLYHGSTVVTLPRFEFEPFLRTMQDYRVTHAFLVPPIILALAKHPLVDQYDLSSLRIITSGAAPLSAQLSESCGQRLGCMVRQGYGMTETSPVTHGQPLGRERVGSIGMCSYSTESKIVDVLTGAELGPGEQGEICVRGPQVMKGYLKRPDATAAMIEPDGWLHTGDIGYVDNDGYFYVVDRLKELIKYKGLQVAPAELEALLITHPAIADAAVIPSPDEEAGEVPKAFVVLKAPITAEEIMAYVAERVAPYKKIRRLAIIDQIPKSPSGKILRRVLIEQERATTAPVGQA
jgi:acyl-CoA synthetase (AMP-forming)/AMP-acid ligase II